jgi:hypothetical protein
MWVDIWVIGLLGCWLFASSVSVVRGRPSSPTTPRGNVWGHVCVYVVACDCVTHHVLSYVFNKQGSAATNRQHWWPNSLPGRLPPPSSLAHQLSICCRNPFLTWGCVVRLVEYVCNITATPCLMMHHRDPTFVFLLFGPPQSVTHDSTVEKAGGLCIDSRHTYGLAALLRPF